MFKQTSPYSLLPESANPDRQLSLDTTSVSLAPAAIKGFEQGIELGVSCGSGVGMVYPSGTVTASQAPAPATYPATYPLPTHGLGAQQPREAVPRGGTSATEPATGRGGLRLRQMNAPLQVMN